MNEAIYELCLLLAREELDLELAYAKHDNLDVEEYAAARAAYTLAHDARAALVAAFVGTPDDPERIADRLAAEVTTYAISVARGTGNASALRCLADGANEARRRVLALDAARAA